jgi:HSP20 family molecular chaperone IbpA
MPADTEPLFNSQPASSRLGGRQAAPAWSPPTDVFTTRNYLVVRVEVAGLQASDFAIHLTGQTLIISGNRPTPSFPGAYHQMEIRFGDFRNEIALPAPVREDGIESHYGNGFLNVTLPLL